MNGELERLRDTERWIGWVRLAGVPFAIFQVAIAGGSPHGYEAAAWLTTVCFGVGSVVLFRMGRRELDRRDQIRFGALALVFDFAVVSAYVLVFSFQADSPVRQVMYLPLVEAALRYGIPGALGLAAASAPVIAVFEWLRERRLAPASYHVDYVTLQVGLEVLLGLTVGWLLRRLLRQTAVAE